ncbi:MAG: VOC family protein [Pseudomonadota bacterium]
MELGAFSMSLAVADVERSAAFYEKLGFARVGGFPEDGWIILRNDTLTLGVFQGHIPENMLTFNPGWTVAAEAKDTFTDVRDIQAALEAKGLTIEIPTDAEGTGPAHIMLRDPDGNQVFIDQHVPRSQS